MKHIRKGYVRLYLKYENSCSISIYVYKDTHIATYWHNSAKSEAKQRFKNQLVLDNIKKNASCALCGYYKYPEALDFHHVIPEDKKFRIGEQVVNRNNFIDELEKCMCLCSNCHRYITRKENGGYKL